MPKQAILLVEDDQTAREVARHNLTRGGYDVSAVGSAEDALKVFDAKRHTVVVTDLRLPGMGGLQLLENLKQARPDLAVIVITAFGDVETAVQAMRRGAYDFIPKPFNRERLLQVVSRAAERATLLKENRRLAREARGIERPIIFRSDAMARCINMVDRVAPSTSAVLITGESGTGKELIARRLHGRSDRADGPFVALNCAAIPPELMESELFGHVAGAFTGATKHRLGRFRQAEGGSFFLDEVAELPLPLQSKLLRVLQEGQLDPVGSDGPLKVDVRVIAATNQDIPELLRTKALREDLFYRLNVIEIPLPPLRERPEDIPLLAAHFIEEAAKGRELHLGDALLRRLQAHSWPGNVRELQNACERLALLAPDTQLRAEDLPPALLRTPAGPTSPPPDIHRWIEERPSSLSLFDIEERVIEHTLYKEGGNLSATARTLGVPRHILAYRVEKFGITMPPSKERGEPGGEG